YNIPRSEVLRAIHFVWRERPRVLNNPVILREVVTHLRKPGSLWQLGLFMLASSIAISIFWATTLDQMQRSMGINITREMFMILNMCFVVFILMLIPLQSASAVNIEKERDSWDLLITTNLSLGSILLGKLVSSLTFVWLIAISLLPMYSILLPLGGISPTEIGFIFIMLTECSLVAALIGLLCSTYCKRVITSITATYMLGGFYFFGLFVLAIFIHDRLHNNELSSWVFAMNPILPAAFFFTGRTPLNNTFAGQHPYITHGILNGILVFAIIVLILWRLSKRDGVRSWEERINDWLDRREKKRLQKRSGAKAPPLRLLPDHRNPVSVIEARGAQGRRNVRSWMMFFALLALPLLSLLFSRNERNYFWFVFPLAPVLVPWLVIPYACNSVRGERDRRTWDLLRTTTLTVKQLMWGKFSAGLNQFQARFWAYAAFPTFVIFWMGYLGDMPNGFEVDDILCILITCYIASVFYLSLGIYLSIVCRKTLTAYAWAFGVALTTYFVIPLLSLLFLEILIRGNGDEVFVFWAAMFSPWIASMAYIDPPRGNEAEYIIVFILQCGSMAWASYVMYIAARDALGRLSERRDDG
ncbi:ABC transporter permease subunit, partial [bacterium]|nr:ABC transporter permease subunit [bacterium]